MFWKICVIVSRMADLLANQYSYLIPPDNGALMFFSPTNIRHALSIHSRGAHHALQLANQKISSFQDDRLPSASSTAIHGCQNSKTGALSVRLKSSCPARTKALSWNTTGPQGPAGTTGIFGAKTNAAQGDAQHPMRPATSGRSC